MNMTKVTNEKAKKDQLIFFWYAQNPDASWNSSSSSDVKHLNIQKLLKIFFLLKGD